MKALLWPVGRYRRILPALTTNQNAGFVTMPFENKIIIFISYLKLNIHISACKPVFLSFIRNFFNQHRLCLSAMHYNENADRLQAVTLNGQPCYSIRFPKAKKGGHSVRAEKTRATYSKF